MLKTSPAGSTIVCDRLTPAILTVWSPCDAVCWRGQPPQETTRGSSCWLCGGGNCRGGAYRLVGRAAAAVELEPGLRHHETGDGFMPRRPRPCAHAPRQGLALRIRGRCRRGHPRGARPGCGPVQPRAWHRPLAGAGGRLIPDRSDLIPGDKCGDAGDGARGRLARAQPFRAASLGRDGCSAASPAPSRCSACSAT